MSDADESACISGLELRYVLTTVLLDRGAALTLTELVERLGHLGVRVRGRPSKTASDALRWEVRKGRVHHVGRAMYAPGRMPRSTEWWIRKRVESVLSRVVAPTLAD